MQGKQQLDMNLVLKGYQEKVGELTNNEIVLNAYIKQLEAKIVELEEQLAPAKTVEQE